jgi:hypothetical protein
VHQRNNPSTEQDPAIPVYKKSKFFQTRLSTTPDPIPYRRSKTPPHWSEAPQRRSPIQSPVLSNSLSLIKTPNPIASPTRTNRRGKTPPPPSKSPRPRSKTPPLRRKTPPRSNTRQRSNSPYIASPFALEESLFHSPHPNTSVGRTSLRHSRTYRQRSKSPPPRIMSSRWSRSPRRSEATRQSISSRRSMSPRRRRSSEQSKSPRRNRPRTNLDSKKFLLQFLFFRLWKIQDRDEDNV